MNKSKFRPLLLGIIILSILITIYMPSISAEKKYNFLFTLQPDSPQFNGWFGYSVAVNGDIIVIGESQRNVNNIQAGQVYIFDTKGKLISILKPSTPDPMGQFGNNVDVFGDIVIVGSLEYSGPLRGAGSAYVFTSEGTLLKTLRPLKPITYGEFSKRVSVSKDIILVSEVGAGEPWHAGEAHIYDSEGTYLKTLLSPSPKPNGMFGRSNAIGDKLVVIGEPGDIGWDKLYPGSAYVFDQNGTLVTTLKAPKPEEHAGFGCSVSTSGDKIVVGEFYATVNNVSKAGRAYIFNTDGKLLQTLQSPTPGFDDEFGRDLEISGDVVVVGAWGADVQPDLREGKAYVFDVNGTLIDTLTAPSPCHRGAFGWKVAIDGDIIVVSEVWAEVEGQSNSGRVHVFSLSAPTQTPTPTPTATATLTPTPSPTPGGSGGSGIPGFPYESIIFGILLGAILLWVLARKI